MRVWALYVAAHLAHLERNARESPSQASQALLPPPLATGCNPACLPVWHRPFDVFSATLTRGGRTVQGSNLTMLLPTGEEQSTGEERCKPGLAATHPCVVLVLAVLTHTHTHTHTHTQTQTQTQTPRRASSARSPSATPITSWTPRSRGPARSTSKSASPTAPCAPRWAAPLHPARPSLHPARPSSARTLCTPPSARPPLHAFLCTPQAAAWARPERKPSPDQVGVFCTLERHQGLYIVGIIGDNSYDRGFAQAATPAPSGAACDTPRDARRDAPTLRTNAVHQCHALRDTHVPCNAQEEWLARPGRGRFNLTVYHAQVGLQPYVLQPAAVCSPACNHV